MSDPLKQLLTRADASAAIPMATEGLASRVRAGRAVRRRNRMLVAGSAALMIMCALIIPFKHSDPPAVAKTSHSIDSMDVDIRLHLMTAALLADSRTRAVPRSVSVPDEVQFQRDRAALVLVYEADRQIEIDRATALAEYRRAIELFPQSHWADVARERIKEIES